VTLPEIVALRKLRKEVEKGNKLKEKEIELLKEIKVGIDSLVGIQ